ncbi:unnamed protein product [Closterium sp. NIES-54]
MRVVSWNINGLPTTFKEAGSKYGSVANFFSNVLRADVLCLQEAKVAEERVERAWALVEGYDSYWAFSRDKKGYSGCVTFVRDGLTPLDAVADAVGPNGLAWEARGADRAPWERGGGLAVDTTDDQAPDAEAGAERDGGGRGEGVVEKGDGEEGDEGEGEGEGSVWREGRCVRTDHGRFVLLNVYVPNAGEHKHGRPRLQRKMAFLRALRAECDAVRASGRHVVVVGDVNISHRDIDVFHQWRVSHIYCPGACVTSPHNQLQHNVYILLPCNLKPALQATPHLLPPFPPTPPLSGAAVAGCAVWKPRCALRGPLPPLPPHRRRRLHRVGPAHRRPQPKRGPAVRAVFQSTEWSPPCLLWPSIPFPSLTFPSLPIPSHSKPHIPVLLLFPPHSTHFIPCTGPGLPHSIDYAVCDAAFLPHVLACDIVRVSPKQWSDHAAVALTLSHDTSLPLLPPHPRPALSAHNMRKFQEDVTQRKLTAMFGARKGRGRGKGGRGEERGEGGGQAERRGKEGDEKQEKGLEETEGGGDSEDGRGRGNREGRDGKGGERETGDGEGVERRDGKDGGKVLKSIESIDRKEGDLGTGSGDTCTWVGDGREETHVSGEGNLGEREGDGNERGGREVHREASTGVSRVAVADEAVCTGAVSTGCTAHVSGGVQGEDAFRRSGVQVGSEKEAADSDTERTEGGRGGEGGGGGEGGEGIGRVERRCGSMEEGAAGRANADVDAGGAGDGDVDGREGRGGTMRHTGRDESRQERGSGGGGDGRDTEVPAGRDDNDDGTSSARDAVGLQTTGSTGLAAVAAAATSAATTAAAAQERGKRRSSGVGVAARRSGAAKRGRRGGRGGSAAKRVGTGGAAAAGKSGSQRLITQFVKKN